MRDFIQLELDKFIKENPYADTYDIALHFYNLSTEDAEKEAKARKEFVDNLPPYYGN